MGTNIEHTDIVYIAKYYSKEEQLKYLSKFSKGTLTQAIDKTIYLLRYKWSLGDEAKEYKIVLTNVLNTLQDKYFI